MIDCLLSLLCAVEVGWEDGQLPSAFRDDGPGQTEEDGRLQYGQDGAGKGIK